MSEVNLIEKPAEDKSAKPEVLLEVVETAKENKEENLLTESDMQEGGFSPQEIEMAKKQNILKKSEDKPKPEVKKDDEQKETQKTEVLNLEDIESDPLKEQEHLKDFNSNEKALYFRQKKEKLKRQKAEAERDQLAIKVKYLEEKEKTKEDVPSKKEDGLSFEDILADGEKSDDDKPLTMKDLKKLQEENERKLKEGQENKQARAQVLQVKLQELEVDAKEKYSDFDAVADLTTEILKDADKLFADDKKTLAKVKFKVNEFLRATANADQFSADEYNPADMCYEIGLMHPKYGKDNAEKGKQDDGLTIDQIKKIERNVSRKSSASLDGGGGSKTVVSMKDITLEQAAKLPTAQFMKLPKEVRERLLRQ